MAFAFKDINLYESIREFQEDQDLVEYPIDLFKLCTKNDWAIRSYSTKDRPNLPRDGFSLLEKGQFFIFYNTYMNSDGRIRFTIAHEIGHIVLNHLFLRDRTENNKEIEKQADYFAGNILLPAPILKEDNYLIKDVDFLKDYFQISVECAQNRLDFYEFWDNKIEYSNIFKSRLLFEFNDGIARFKDKKVNTLNKRLSTLPAF
jgi:hypothetical protein